MTKGALSSFKSAGYKVDVEPKGLFNSLVVRAMLAANLLAVKSCGKHKQLKGLILAQNERWRRGLGMRVARECSNTGKRRKGEDNMGICPGDEDSVGKLTVIPDNIQGSKEQFAPG